MNLSVNDSEGPTVFHPAVAEATDEQVVVSVMVLPRRAKSPRAHRRLNNKANVQGSEDYWNRISGRSSEATADCAHPTSTRNIESLSPGVSYERGHARETVPSIWSADKSEERA